MKIACNKPYNFANDSYIRAVCTQYNAKYLGSWCIKDKNGNWTERPVEVFYQRNPDTHKGHSNYFGLFLNLYNSVMICNAESAFSESIPGILEDGLVYVSRYRHDYVTIPDVEGAFIDGGRDYLRYNASIDNKFVIVKVVDGEFVFTPQE